MKIKTQLFALVLAAGTASAAHAATTGTLTFEGQVNGGTCALAAGDVNRTIILPDIKVSDLSGGTSAGAATFNLTATCDSDITDVTFAFTGTKDPNSSYRFANTGTAGGTALWLYSNIGGTVSTIRADIVDSRSITASSGTAVLPLGAAYYNVGTVSKGTLLSSVTVDITYN